MVSHLDLSPTILDFYGIATPKAYRGHNLLSGHANRFIISEAAHNKDGVYISGYTIFPSNFKTYAIRTAQWKYIYREGKCELYNLKEDPKETKNVVDEKKVKANEFEAIVKEHILWEEKLQKHRTFIHEVKRIRRKIKKLKSLSKI